MKRLVGLCAPSGVCTTAAWHSARAQSMEARQLMQATNEDRAHQGLGPLKWDPALARAAQTHAELMVRQGALSHQYTGESDLVTRVAPTPSAVETEWMH